MADEKNGTGQPSKRYSTEWNKRYWNRWDVYWTEVGFTEGEVESLLAENIAPSSPTGKLIASCRRNKIEQYMHGRGKLAALTREKAIERANRVREAEAAVHDQDSDYIWAELYSVDDETRKHYARMQSRWDKRRDIRRGKPKVGRPKE